MSNDILLVTLEDGTAGEAMQYRAAVEIRNLREEIDRLRKMIEIEDINASMDTGFRSCDG